MNSIIGGAILKEIVKNNKNISDNIKGKGKPSNKLIAIIIIILCIIITSIY